MPRYLAILSVFVTLALPARAQEIRALVSLNQESVQSSGLDYLDQIIGLTRSYINKHIWTEKQVDQVEQLDVNMQIILNRVTGGSTFSANLVLSLRRPIYNTTQQTVVLNLIDEDWVFTFDRNKNVIHDEVAFDGIASIYDFYVYLILGLDADTFAPLGGKEFYERAQFIVNNAQGLGDAGWTRSPTRVNRFLLVQMLLDPQYNGFRQALYLFHRKGLDTFLTDPEGSRQRVFEALTLLKDTRRQVTQNFLFQNFYDAKFREITDIFMEAEPEMKIAVYQLLSEIDPSHLNQYEVLRR